MKLLGTILLLAAAVPTSDPRYFKFERPVQLPSNAPGQSCFVPDEQTFAHAALGLADLRLYRGSEQVPYVLRNATPRPASRPAIKALNLGRRGKQTVFDAEMPEGEYRDIDLSVTGHDFLAVISVSGSQTPSSPTTHIGSYTIFDFTGQHLGRSTVLHLPESNFRILHFAVSGPVGPEQIGDMLAVPQTASKPIYFPLEESAAFAQKGHMSVAELTVPAHVPVDQIVLEAPAQPVNFSRPIRVAVTPKLVNPSENDQPLASSNLAEGQILRIHRVFNGRAIDEERLFVNVPEIFYEEPTEWKITIENGDDAPIQFAPVRLAMIERDLCFDSAGTNGIALFYGDSTLTAPRYDYATWSSPRPVALTATLGAELQNPAYTPRPDARPFTEKHPALLWTALFAVILLLGGIALRSSRHMQPPASMP
ncbi:MAG TPA: hypothetical protein VK716_06420 [Terracidiphilus sp.]|nr:hypothetical protein [Terracidiphilus sp.]